jgi:hypothetical protein
MPVHLRITLAAAAGAVALLSPGAPALANGSETLSLAVNGPSVAGRVTTFTAGGVDADESIGGYDLDVYIKPTAVDPTCAPTDGGEQEAWMGDFANEFHPVVGLLETIDPGPFSVGFKYDFPHAGRQLLCAYTDGLAGSAAAQLTVDVQAPAGGGPATPPPPSGGAAAKPAVVHLPRVVRAGRRLVCRRGTWTGASRFSYRWLVAGHMRAHGQRLAIRRALRGRVVRCGVSAANAAGVTSALSRGYRMR